ncbi:hypothetical protein BDQ17DRAFT_1428961 [Cyathus striatus]|nr:hypothetical protein BDQ17DRAFT_1428961 [Cyathus striatus]
MSEGKSSSGARKRGPYIQRGTACVNCRRRKMKCDGIHPVCGPCAHSGHSEDCEFTASMSHLSQSQILEQNIAMLEARLEELQQAERNGAPAVQLSDPYTASEAADERNIANFMVNQQPLGFFLDARPSGPRSFKVISSNGMEIQPSNALQSAIRLWGARLGREPGFAEQEPILVNKALQAASVSVSDSHPNGIMHGIQADVLLANYFLSDMRFVEGKYHILTALSMILTTGIQGGSNPPPICHYNAEGFWGVLVMDQCWASVFNSTPNMNIMSISMHQVPQGKVSDIVHNLKSFLNDPSTGFLSRSTREYAARAAVVIERIIDTKRNWNLDTSMASMNNPELMSILSRLERLVQALKGTLPPLVRGAGAPYDHYSVLGNLIFYVAAMKLYGISASRVATSKQKQLYSAEMIINIVTSNENRSCTLDPIVAMIWKEAVHAILNEMLAVRKAANAGGSSVTHYKSENELLGIYRRALTAVLDCSTLTRYQQQRVQDTYTNM